MNSEFLTVMFAGWKTSAHRGLSRWEPLAPGLSARRRWVNRQTKLCTPRSWSGCTRSGDPASPSWFSHSLQQTNALDRLIHPDKEYINRPNSAPLGPGLAVHTAVTLPLPAGSHTAAGLQPATDQRTGQVNPSRQGIHQQTKLRTPRSWSGCTRSRDPASPSWFSHSSQASTNGTKWLTTNVCKFKFYFHY